MSDYYICKTDGSPICTDFDFDIFKEIEYNFCKRCGVILENDFWHYCERCHYKKYKKES